MIEKAKKRRKFSIEILLTVGLCLLLSAMLCIFIVFFGRGLIDEYILYNDIVLDEFELYHLDVMLVGGGVAVSVLCFVILFFALFGERIAYIRKLTAGVHALGVGDYGNRVELVGNNELTQLAEAINYLSESEQKIKEKEKKLNDEREELIRTLSHDIRTPLTSIMSYTELLGAKQGVTAEEQREYVALVGKKTAQIKQLTDILLDGGRRNVEYFEDVRLLFEQLAEEFESTLESEFSLNVDLSHLPATSGRFDVGEMRRIFDNLISNVEKYAEPAEAVALAISKNDNGIEIRQSNGIKKGNASSESYKMGLSSIRRVAHGYDGTVQISEDSDKFEIIITLSNICKNL